MLVSEGVLHSRSGFGTEVLRKPIDNSKVFGPSEGLMSVVGEEHVDSEIHTFSIELPSKKVAEMLQIDEKDYIYNIVRSRFVDQQPYSLRTNLYAPFHYPWVGTKASKKIRLFLHS